MIGCIEQRAAAFQGFSAASSEMEDLQVVRYGVSNEFRDHYDWGEEVPRQSTFFVYLDADCTGGGTNFPLLDAPIGKEWCKYLDCNGTDFQGVAFKPIVGSALFWENIRSDGTLHSKTLHAGLPVTSGTKVGLNIWTREKKT